MNNLVESIIADDLVSASEIFESRIAEIMEAKLYEKKRSIQIGEVVTPVKGKPGEFKGQNTPKDWAKYREQHPSFGMHDVPTKTGKPKKAKAPSHEKTASGGLTAKGIAVRKKAGYLQAHPALKAKEFIDKVIHYHKTGEIIEEGMYKPGELDPDIVASKIKAAKASKKPRLQPGALGTGSKGKKGKEKPTPAGTQRGFTAPLTRAGPGAQRGFTAPLKGPEKTPEKDYGGLAKQNIQKALGSGTSFSGRVRALKRAGKAASMTTTGRVAGAVGGRLAKGAGAALSDFGSQYGSFEE